MSYSHSLVSLPAIWSALISSRSYLARALYFDWTTEYSYTSSRVKTSATLRHSCTSLRALAGTTISESILRDCSSVTRALSGSARHIRLVQALTLLTYSHSSGAQSNIVMADFLRISMRERAPCTLCALDPCAIRSLCTPILLRVVRDASSRQLCLTQHSDGAHSALGALLFSNTLSNVPL